MPANLDSSNTALKSFSSNAPHSTANIQAHVLPEFSNTDLQSRWSPNSAAPALPAPPASQFLTPEGVQRDFVLFDSPHLRPRTLNHAAPSLPSGQRRHSCQKLSSPAVKDQPVAQLFGYQSLSNPHIVNQPFYASSAPSSTLSLHPDQSNSSVPHFQQTVDGGVPTANMMNAADVDLGDLTTFGDAPPVFPSALQSSGGKSSASSNFTVSPQDLFLSDPFMSAPNSAALTTLTSPSLCNGSPEFDGLTTSPDFGSTELDVSADNWYPLFPVESNGSTDQVQSVDSSPEQPVETPEESASNVHKKMVDSPPIGGGRFSSVAGVNARKRDKNLPPIIVEDPNDTVAVKRARNTMAARKSRERKAQRVTQLEQRITELEADRDHWKRLALMGMEGQ
ncbi:hypothetical protein CP533_3140 [Ophiocordyceps camponoti-saundersi (nom. inval.)]|nr:hypothetical protein CP533_3140 [Ophiocordyceps camponoti-saundersi (nom. inval.)]